MFRLLQIFGRGGKARADNQRVQLMVEQLEDRLVQSATALPAALPAPATPLYASSAVPLFTNPVYTTTTVYDPAQIRTAYGFNREALDGTGQTIAIVVAYDEPTIQSDLKMFDQLYSLKDAPQLNVFKQGSDGFFYEPGQMPSNVSPPSQDDKWVLEAAADVEWAHAIAPGANIDLVEAQDGSAANLFASANSAVNFAKTLPGVTVVSMSWGFSEFEGENTFDSTFSAPGVTFVSGAGDHGGEVDYPAACPNVLSVGGTELTLDANNKYASETAWSSSGGGVSQFEHAPSWQNAVQTYGMRTEPDVSYNASDNTRIQVYCQARAGFWTSPGFAFDGVSGGVPQWAGLIALVNQGRAHAGHQPLNNAVRDLYSIPSRDFHDVVDGFSSTPVPWGYVIDHWAHDGYDLVTGLGTPKAPRVINALIHAEPILRAGTVKIVSTPTTIVSSTTVLTAQDNGPLQTATPLTVAAVFPAEDISEAQGIYRNAFAKTGAALSLFRNGKSEHQHDLAMRAHSAIFAAGDMDWLDAWTWKRI